LVPSTAAEPSGEDGTYKPRYRIIVHSNYDSTFFSHFPATIS